MEVSETATAEERRDDGPLAGLAVLVNQAIAFAEERPKEYRARAFDLAWERLNSGSATAAPSVAPAASGVTSIVTGGLAALARELSIDPRQLARVVEIGEEGRLSIIGRLGEVRTRAEQQVQYSAAYCHVKERVFGQLDTPIEELRGLCQDKGCYDGNNFTANFKKSGLLSEVSGKGAARAYRLSNKGMEVAKDVLRKMVES